MSFPRSDRAFIAVLVGSNLVLKLAWLGVNELAHDEPFTVYWALRPMSELWAMLGTENNPPLYFLLMKAWSAVVTLDAGLLRIPSALFSALVVWPLFMLARQLGGLRVAGVASLLFTLSNYHYGYAHEVRAYSLFTLLAVTSMWLLMRNAESSTRRSIGWLAVVNILMVYTHFFGWLMIGVQGLCLLLPELKSNRRVYFTALWITVVSYVPYAATFLGRIGNSVREGTWLGTPVPEELYNMIWRWSNAPVLAVLFLVLIGVAVWRTKAKDQGMRIGLIWAFIPLFSMFAVSYWAPVFLDRYLVYASPGFALLLASSIGAFATGRHISTACSFAVVLGMALTFHPWWDGGLHPSHVVDQVREWQEGHRPVLIAPGYYAPTFTWYLDKDLLSSAGPLDLQLTERSIFLVDDPDRFVGLDPEEDAVILVDAWSALTDPEQLTKQHLRSHWPQVDSVEADHKVWVYRFRR